MKNNQKGFSAIELVLILVIVGLLGLVGWLVYTRNKPADNKSDQQETSKITQTSEQKFLEIPGWNVKVPLTSDIEDLVYEGGKNASGASTSSAKFYTKRAKDAQVPCSYNYSTLTLVRGKGNDVMPLHANDDETFQQQYDKRDQLGDGGFFIFKVGDYFYINALGGAACENNDDPDVQKATLAERERHPAIKKAVQSMQPL